MTFEQAVDQAFMPAMCDHLEIKSISNSNQVVADAVASVVSRPDHRLIRLIPVGPGEWIERKPMAFDLEQIPSKDTCAHDYKRRPTV